MKRRKLDFTKDFLREIAKLPPKHFKQVVGKALVLLIEVEPPDSKQLEGYDGLWRSTPANTGSSMRTTTRSCSSSSPASATMARCIACLHGEWEAERRRRA